MAHSRQDNVALIAVLEALDPPDPMRGGKQLLCVANTHIHANPELADVKLWQVGKGGGVTNVHVRRFWE